MAKDVFHDIVVKALEAEEWNITDDPLYISVGLVELYIDLGAEKIIGAEKAGEKIAVEIKIFLGASNLRRRGQRSEETSELRAINYL